jgi:hypothetical protein
MTPTPPLPSDCAAFEAAVQRVLDRELGFDALDVQHAAECPDCRALGASAKLLATGLDRMGLVPQVEIARTDRIAAAAAWDYRVRRRVTWVGRAAAVALAASILVAAILYGPWVGRTNQPDIVRGREPSPEPAPERVADRVADAGSALASITRKATDQALTPTRNLIPPPESVTLPETELATTVEPAAESLAAMPQAAKSGIEPMTTGARRAVSLFLRDTGITPKPKS